MEQEQTYIDGLPPELTEIVAAWAKLPEYVKQTIVALIKVFRVTN